MASLTLTHPPRPRSESKSNAGELLRLDTRGRVRTGRERREGLLAEFDRSGISAARFARMAGIKYQTFAGWLHVRRREGAVGSRPAKRAKPVRWLEAVADSAAVLPESDPLRVQLPGGAWMEVASPAHLQQAARLLRELDAKGGAPC